MNGTPWVHVLAGAVALSSSVCAGQPAPVLSLPADYEPIMLDGVALFETPANYRVRLRFQAPGRAAVETAFGQDNRTNDKLRLASPPRQNPNRSTRDELVDLDAYYRRWNFHPVEAATLLKPTGMPEAYNLGENVPTFRQICGGYALGPLLRDRYRVPTGMILSILEGIGSRTEKPDAWDIVAFYRQREGLRESVSHFALIESASPLAAVPGVDNSSVGKTILTKNQEERAYRGTLSDYVSSTPLKDATGLGVGELAPASRVNAWDFVFFSIPWNDVVVTRAGGPFADDRSLLVGTPTILRVQVVNAETYELIPSSEVVLRFAGNPDPLKAYEAPTGVLDLSQVPGSSGRFEVTAKAKGFKRAVLPFKLNAGIPVNAIVALSPGKDADDEVVSGAVRGKWTISVRQSIDKPAPDGSDLTFTAERVRLLGSGGFTFENQEDFYAAAQTPRDKKYDPYMIPTLARVRVLGRTVYEPGMNTDRWITLVLPPGRHAAVVEAVDLSGQVLASSRHTIVCNYDLPDSRPDDARARARAAAARNDHAEAFFAWIQTIDAYSAQHKYDMARAAIASAVECMAALPKSTDRESDLRGARRRVAERECSMPGIVAVLAEYELAGKAVLTDRARFLISLGGDWQGCGRVWRTQNPKSSWPFVWPE